MTNYSKKIVHAYDSFKRNRKDMFTAATLGLLVAILAHLALNSFLR